MPRLPEKLPAALKIVWRKPLASRGLGGVAAVGRLVIVADRELSDSADAFRALDAATGADVWSHRYPAAGKLDYGSSSRATPLVDGDRVFLQGAHGHLTCLDLEKGRRVWQISLRDEFDVSAKMPWGFCGSPLIVDGKLVVAAGGPEASLVALDPETGEPVWESPGAPASYGSLIVAELGGRRQIVGHDAGSLGGWDPQTGRRLWKVVPPNPNDFNVATPLVHRGRLIVSTENNGTRMFAFSDGGQIVPKPAAHFKDLAPDTHTPVIVGDRLLGAYQELFCLDLANDLKVVWTGGDEAFQFHTSLIASPDRVLATTHDGELLLVDALADSFRLLGRLQVFENETDVLSHPALVGDRLYLRGNSELVCVALEI